jgi:hypothetical protein
MTTPYVVPPPEGFHAAYEPQLRRAHDRHAAQLGCGGSLAHDWRHCETFALLKVRGVGHSVYVVPVAAAPWGTWYRIVLHWNEGPAAATGLVASDPLEGWGPTLLHALAMIALDEPECAETLPAGQHEALVLAVQLAEGTP